LISQNGRSAQLCPSLLEAGWAYLLRIRSISKLVCFDVALKKVLSHRLKTIGRGPSLGFLRIGQELPGLFASLFKLQVRIKPSL
jgi:hypothetical protein